MSFLRELNRRNVFRVAVAYAVSAWLLIQVAETIFPLFGFDDTPARIVVVVLAIGFIPALVFAWAFEITPEGIKREADVDRSPNAAFQASRNLDRIIALVLALALGYFAFDKFVLDPARDAALVEETVQQARSDALVESYGEHSIAVLPFENMSNDPEQEYFSDGMAEELLNLLAQVPRLRVISRSSSFAFKGQPINVPTIAQQLGVNHVLEGSVRKHGDRVRITAQLIEARSDTHLWSQTFERRLDDVFAIQDEISAAIVAQLGEKLSLELGRLAEVRAPENTEAYEAYLRGRHLMAQRTAAGMEAAVREFEQAVALDPDYALGHASLAIALCLSSEYKLRSVEDAWDSARPHAELALRLNPNLAEAHTAMAWVIGPGEANEEHLRNAVRINPSYSDAMVWLGHQLMGKLDYAGSFTFYQRAEELDPLSIPAKINVIWSLMWRGRLEEAGRKIENLAALHSRSHFISKFHLVSFNGGWADGALAILEGMQEPEKATSQSLQFQLALMGLAEEALSAPPAIEPSIFDMTELGGGEPVWTLRLLGRPDEALQAWQQQPGGIPQSPGLGYRQSGVLIAATGDFARAGPILERAWPTSDPPVGIGNSSGWDANFILALKSVRQARGGEAGIAELQAALKDAVRRYVDAGLVVCEAQWGCVHFDAGVSAYLDGNREEGLALIARAVESGYFIPPNHAYLQFLYDDPGFGLVLEKQAAHQAREREEFLSVVCQDNPYADVWQPAEETCREFNAARVGG